MRPRTSASENSARTACWFTLAVPCREMVTKVVLGPNGGDPEIGHRPNPKCTFHIKNLTWKIRPINLRTTALNPIPKSYSEILNAKS